MKKIETRTAIISYVEKGIVFVKFKPNTRLDKPDIFKNMAAATKIARGRHCAILEINKNSGITDAALKYAESKDNAKNRIANALLIKSASVKLLWSFFSMFFKPTVQNQIFTSKKAALIWLRKFQ